MRKLLIVLSMTIITGFWACSGSQEKIPQQFGELPLAKVTKGQDAKKAIDELHGLEVGTADNLILEYKGEHENDLVYVTVYDNREACEQDYKLMIDKMLKAENSPFYHITEIPEYEGKLYMAIGMGALHYIYLSDNNLVWVQTYQDLGRELPKNLSDFYPVR